MNNTPIDLIIISVIIIILFFIGIFFTKLLMPRVIQTLKNSEIYGTDVHKLSKPKIPEMGGIGFFTSAFIILIIALFISYFLFQEQFLMIIATIGVITIAFLIGLFDDLRKRRGKGLGGKTKPILCLSIGLPIWLLDVYKPSLPLPFLGSARLTIVYPILIFLICTVCSNTMNMIDVYNGAMPGVSIITFITILGASLIFLSLTGVLLSTIFLGILIAYFQFNKYPAQIFSGDVGSLTIGAAFAVTIILSKTEIIGVIVSLPLIMNSFQIIRSFGGFKEHSEIKNKPVVLLPNEKIDISLKKDVPVTLTGLILVKGPLNEQEIVKVFHVLVSYSAIFALITAFITILY